MQNIYIEFSFLLINLNLIFFIFLMLKYKNLFRKSTLQNNIFMLNKFYKRFSSIISIDMGATNTCIAILEAGGPRVIENAEGKIL